MDEDSSPCFAHLLINGQPVDPQTRKDVAQFRRAERQRLMGLRKQLSAADLKQQSARVIAALDRLIGDVAGQVIALYWPIRGELDLRGWMRDLEGRGAKIALPVVITRDAPVAFHHWTAGCAMTRGIWNIPVPAEPVPLTPDVVVSPLLGVDARGYRLGNGGGYYDRTLAALPAKPLVIGVGHDFCEMPTIFPMPWDIAMDRIVLGDGSVRPA
jgi:5-formyltetrahydrofolate cyclo-ligase